MTDEGARSGINSPSPLAPRRYGVPALDPTQTQTLLGFRVRRANPRVYSFPCAQRQEDKKRRGAGGRAGQRKAREAQASAGPARPRPKLQAQTANAARLQAQVSEKAENFF